MSLVVTAVVLSSVNLAGDVTTGGGDYVAVDFVVPAGAKECQIAHSDGDPDVILDWGLWSPTGFRGWGGGLTDDAVVGELASSRGYLPGPMDAGTWQVLVGKAKLINGKGHYALTITCNDTASLTPVERSPYTPNVVASGPRWWRGDLHVHSEQSGDANATLPQIAAFAQSRNLDFVAISDHNTIAQHALIAEAQKSLRSFLFLRSNEVTTYQGHGNALGAAAYVDHRIGFAGASATTIINEVTAQGGIFTVNHPELRLGGECIGCAWEHADTPWAKVAAIEVHTGAYDVVEMLFTPKAIARWDALEDAGHHLAAVGGSDDHRGGAEMSATKSQIGAPTTMVWADQLSEASLITGIKQQRTYVKLRGPDDPDIEFTVRKPDDTQAMIGDVVTDLNELLFTLHVKGGAGTYAGIWRNGVLVGKEVLVTSDDFTTSIAIEPGGALERFRLELSDEGGHRVVVTSHIYAQAHVSSAGCGCASDRAGGAGLWAAVGLLGVLRRRRARA